MDKIFWQDFKEGFLSGFGEDTAKFLGFLSFYALSVVVFIGFLALTAWILIDVLHVQ
jgi:hypothetical protein